MTVVFTDSSFAKSLRCEVFIKRKRSCVVIVLALSSFGLTLLISFPSLLLSCLSCLMEKLWTLNPWEFRRWWDNVISHYEAQDIADKVDCSQDDFDFMDVLRAVTVSSPPRTEERGLTAPSLTSSASTDCEQSLGGWTLINGMISHKSWITASSPPRTEERGFTAPSLTSSASTNYEQSLGGWTLINGMISHKSWRE